VSTTLDEYRREFQTMGCVLVPHVVPPQVAMEWADRATSAASNRVDREDSGDAVALDEGGAYHHAIADGLEVQKILPELYGFYEGACLWLSYITGRSVITSPYPRSAVTLKVYDRPGDGQGWHRDTNALTALLILTDTDGDYGTLVEGRNLKQFNVRNHAGDLWMMYGRELRHMVPPLPDGVVRVTVPLNYYFTDDVWRPEDADGMIYGA
jgi:hypothetical protein